MERNPPGEVRDGRNADQIAQRVDLHILVEVRVYRHCADVSKQDGVAVGSRAGDDFDADVAAGAGAVLDYDLLAQQLHELRLDDTGDEVGRATGRERNDHADRLCRVIGRRLRQHDIRSQKHRNRQQ